MDENPLALLLQYLDASSQPTFVLRLSHTALGLNSCEYQAIFAHANAALERLHSLHQNVLHSAQQALSALSHATIVGGSIQQTASFCGISWTVTIVDNRWLIAVSQEQHVHPTEGRPVEPPQNSLITSAAISRESSSDTQTWIETPDLAHTNQRLPLGAVSPHGHLGDLDFLVWMRHRDWTSSPIGAIEKWPAELRQICEYALATPEAINILWGDECTMLYNQAYSVIVGDKHPAAMGRPFKENFQQWPEYYRIFDRMRATGQSIRQEKVRRMLVRDGFLEEDFFNFLMTPILAPDGSVAGITTRILETTQQVIFERRIQILTNINEAMATAYTVHDLCAAVGSVLDKCTGDVHFAAIYSTDRKDQAFDLNLVATAGMKQERSSSPPQGDLDVPHFGLLLSLLEVCNTGEMRILSTSDSSLTQNTLDQLGIYGVSPCREIVIHPLGCFTEDNLAAVMIVGTTPLRKFDEDYRSFIQLLVKQIENGITVIKGIAREKELHRAQVASEIERRFWRFAENAPVGMYMYNSDDVLTFWNAAFEAISGRLGSELSHPRAWMDTIHPDGVADIIAIQERYTQSKCEDTITFEIQFKKPWTSQSDSDEAMLDRTYALGILQPHYSEDGKLNGILGCITDISSVKWAEKMQSARLSEAIEQRRQQENFLDVTSHEMRNPLNAIFQCAHELTENIKLKLENSQGTQAQIEKLKECYDLASTITYCANHQKRIVDDVLTLSKLDARLLHIYPESTNPIKFYKDILGLFAPEIRAANMNTNFIVGEGYNRLELKLVMMDPSRVAQVVINLLSNAIKFTKKGKKRDLEMTLNAHLQEPADKPMDTRYVASGVQHHDPTNLPEWGQGEEIYLSFSVKDSGLGMTPEEASNLFQKFSQASPRTHAQFGGSGLGLYISRNLTELHGGRIGLSSQAGFGSKFEFYVKVRRSQSPEVPLTQDDRPLPRFDMEHLSITSPAMQQLQPVRSEQQFASEAEAHSPQPPPYLQKNVLIVEDNLINQRLLRKLITKHGYDTLTANNGEEALALIASSTWNPVHTTNNSDIVPTIDIVLCDIEMPIMDGKTCVRRVRQLQQESLLADNITMIAITGNARLEQIEEMRRCGFDDVVTKPYKIDQLLRVIERYLNNGPRD